MCRDSNIIIVDNNDDWIDAGLIVQDLSNSM